MNDAIPTHHIHYGLPGSIRNFTGGATSAGKMKKKVGVIDNSKVLVENGRRITCAELCRSINQAADQFLNARERRAKNSKLTVYSTEEPAP